MKNKQDRHFGFGANICTICFESNRIKIRDIFDDRYGCPDIFSLDVCVSCGHVMTTPRLAEFELGELYSTYYPRKSVNTRDLIAASDEVVGCLPFIKRWWNGTNNQGQYYIKQNNLMLDVGCGSGLSLLEAQKLGGDAYGVEADPNIKRIADELDLKIHIGSLHDNPFPGVFFDLIVLNQVVEHIPDPGKALASLKERLNEKGRIILVIPNRDSLWRHLSKERWINWHVPYHLHHFDVKGISALVEGQGYRVIKKTTITPNLWTLLQIQALFQKSQISISSEAWKANLAGNNQKTRSKFNFIGFCFKAIKRLTKVIVLTALALLNRILDLMGQGDSLLVIIEPRH
jgi:SAM-dependent methyltransferase